MMKINSWLSSAVAGVVAYCLSDLASAFGISTLTQLLVTLTAVGLVVAARPANTLSLFSDE